MSLEATTALVSQMAEKTAPIGNTLKFAFNESKGFIYLDGSGASNVVSNEDREATCTVKLDYEDFQALLNKDLDPMGAFLGGKLQIEGDMMVAMSLQSLLS